MKRVIAGLVFAAPLLAGCMGDGLNLPERAGIVRADSSCDGAATNDPASHCFVARRRQAD